MSVSMMPRRTATAEARRLLLGGQDAGQHLDASLGRTVHGLARRRVCAAAEETLMTRRFICETAKMRQYRLASATAAARVHCQRVRNLARRQPPQRADRTDGCRVVQQAHRRGPALLQALQHRRQRGVDARGVGQIETHELITLSHDRRVTRPADAGHHEAALQQLGGESGAQAAGDARDDGDMLTGTVGKTHCRDVSRRRTQRRRSQGDGKALHRAGGLIPLASRATVKAAPLGLWDGS